MPQIRREQYQPTIQIGHIERYNPTINTGKIDIKNIKIPDFGEGIVFAPSFAMFASPGKWLTSSFFKYFIGVKI